MKLLTIIALAVAMIGMSACAHKEQQQSGGGSYQSSSSMSHSK
jgi:hypothetical protein